ncbi:MAG: hypothetical protein ACI4MW_01170 [Christensenellales bacterium]
MKKKVLLCLVVILVLSFSLSLFAACKKDENPSGNNNGGTTAPSIAEILSDGKTDTEYTVEGVVFGKKNDGFLISDGENAIFIESNENVAAGDKVSVKGTLKLNTEKAPVLGNAQVTVSANGQTVVSPVKGLLTDVTKLAATRKNFYKYVEATGFVRFNAETSVYTLESGSSRVIIDTNGRDADFEEFVDKKVTLSFVNTGFTTSWKVLYLGDVQKFEVNLAEVKDAIFESVGKQLPEEVYVGIELPVNYADEPDVTFTWSVVTADAPITIVDNVATVSEVSEDTTVTIKLTLTAPESQTAEKTFEILVKKATNVAIADIAAYEGTDVIVFSGTVYAKGYSQTKDRTALMVSDGANHYTAVDIAKTDFFKYTVGDKVKVAGTKAVVVDVNTVSADSIIVTEAAPDDFTIDFESLEYTELRTDDATTYTGLVDNYLANTNKLYKITAPFMVSSGNTSSNFIRFGHDVNAGKGYEYKVDEVTKKRYFVFSRNTMDDTVSWLQSELNVPNLDNGAVKYEGYTFYAFAMFSSPETWQFVLPGEFAVATDNAFLANKELTNKMDAYDIVVAKEAGSIDLPKTLKYGGEVTWTQDKDVFDLDTGAFTAVTANTAVTLTATYTVKGATEPTIKTFLVTLLPNDPEYVTVSEALADTSGGYMYVEGVVVGLIPSHTGSGKSLGVYVSDGNKVAPVEFGGQLLIGADNHSAYIGKDEVKVGTGIRFSKIKVDDKNQKLVVSDKTTCTITGNVDVSGNWLHPAEVTTTINNATEMAKYVKGFNALKTSDQRDYSIVKVVATEENPIYIGPAQSNKKGNAKQKYFLSISYLSDTTVNSTNIADFSYAAGDSASTPAYFGSHIGCWKYALGDQWVLDNTPVSTLGDYSAWAVDGLSAEAPAGTYKFTGSFYMIFEYMGSADFTFGYCGILGAGFNLTRVVEEAA